MKVLVPGNLTFSSEDIVVTSPKAAVLCAQIVMKLRSTVFPLCNMA